ncbi:MAG: sulfite exporter TauE/SafE family protein [Clostridia bacterium]|nr:sulfite exporter TauE/SafE family protein [Clostridia bacterium]
MSGKQTTWYIAGMYCPHCDQAVLKAVSGLDGLTEAQADYHKGTLTAEWDSSMLSEKVLIEHLAEAGYTVKPQKGNLTALQRFLQIVLMLAVLTGLFALLALTPIRSILSAFPVARAGMSLGALFVLGLMTSLHCVAMCGGINLAQSAGAVQAGNKVSWANLLYNGGRLISYTVLGGIVGAIGSVFRLSIPVQAAIQILAAVFMALMSLNLLDIDSLQGWFPTLPNSLRNRLMRHETRSSLYIGLLNGLMPCGPLQAMQIYALSTGSWQTGAQSMLFFCLGTTPLMLGFGLVSGTLNRRFAKPMRIASGVLILIMGMSMLINGLSLAGIPLRPLTGNTADTTGHDSEVQIVQSELNWQGYPDITVRAGVPVRWVIHADEEKITGCNNEMVIPALDLRVPLSPGDNIVEFTVDEPGVIPYTCWMGMLNGSITAVEAE